MGTLLKTSLPNWGIRTLFAGLILVEFAAVTGLVTLQGEYNWFDGMVITAAVVWALTEANLFFFAKVTGTMVPIFVPFFAVCAVYLDSLGDIFHWYGEFSWYDQVVHTTGGLAATCAFYFFFTAWAKRQKYNLNHWPLLFTAITTTGLAGAFYEIEEYLEDYFHHVVGLRLGDGIDTANDLLCDVLGSLLAAAVLTLFIRVYKNRRENQRLVT